VGKASVKLVVARSVVSALATRWDLSGLDVPGAALAALKYPSEEGC
jgi:hypothetical protein